MPERDTPDDNVALVALRRALGEPGDSGVDTPRVHFAPTEEHEAAAGVRALLAVPARLRARV